MKKLNINNYALSIESTIEATDLSF